MIRTLAALTSIAAAAAAAIAINLALLDYATSRKDPVGHLSPRAHLPAAPADVVRPHSGPAERDRADD